VVGCPILCPGGESFVEPPVVKNRKRKRKKRILYVF
jgi:hypothetical protein